MKAIEASIIIPTHNKLSRLRLVLKAFEKQMIPSVELIIVFDGCSNETIEEYKKLNFSFKPKEIFCNENVGRAAARNIGIKHAQGKIIIFVDDDRIPDENFIKKHLKGHKQKCVLLGNRREIQLSDQEIEDLYYQTGNLKDCFNKSKLEFGRQINIRPMSIYRWFRLYTGNVSIEKEDLVKIQGFDEKFKVWGNEDLDLGIRLQKLNLPFIQDLEIVNYHLMHESNFADKRKDSIKNLKYMVKKYRKDLLIRLRLHLMIVRQSLFGI